MIKHQKVVLSYVEKGLAEQKIKIKIQHQQVDKIQSLNLQVGHN